MVEEVFTLHRSEALDDKMRIPVIIMFYTAGKGGSDTIQREKSFLNAVCGFWPFLNSVCGFWPFLDAVCGFG